MDKPLRLENADQLLLQCKQSDFEEWQAGYSRGGPISKQET